MSASLDPTIKHQIDGMVRDLCSEFAGQFDRQQIENVMNDSVERVLDTATVFDFVPLMAYRFTRERLHALARAQGQDAQGTWDVVFVSLSGGGRGQIAAALTTLLSEGRVSVHSAGTAVHGQIDPGVRAVVTELGVDAGEQFARPVTDEAARRGRDRDDGPQRRRCRHPARRSAPGPAGRRPARRPGRGDPTGPRRHRAPRQGAAAPTRRASYRSPTR